MKAELIAKSESILKLKVSTLPESALQEISSKLEGIDSLDEQQQQLKLYKAVLEALCGLLNKPWSDLTNYINSNPQLIDFANKFVIKAHHDHHNDPMLAELLVCLLEHNNILFHKIADYNTYQELANCSRDLVETQKVAISPTLKARHYSDSVYADYFMQGDESKKAFETKLLESISLFESTPSLLNERFLAYINISQFYLFQGKLDKTSSYLEKAKELVGQIAIPNYQALFWYHYSWLHVEKGEYQKAKENIDIFFAKLKESEVSPAIYLHAMNIHASIDFRLGNLDQAYAWASKCYDHATKFYETDAKDVIAENLVTMSRFHLKNKNIPEAEKAITHAIASFEKVFGSPTLDPSQAVAHVILGEIYTETRKYKQAKDEYLFAEKFYEGFYKENFFKMNEVSILLADLAILGHKSGDRKLEVDYMKKLTDNFPADNANVIRAQQVFKEAARDGL